MWSEDLEGIWVTASIPNSIAKSLSPKAFKMCFLWHGGSPSSCWHRPLPGVVTLDLSGTLGFCWAWESSSHISRAAQFTAGLSAGVSCISSKGPMRVIQHFISKLKTPSGSLQNETRSQSWCKSNTEAHAGALHVVWIADSRTENSWTAAQTGATVAIPGALFDNQGVLVT